MAFGSRAFSRFPAALAALAVLASCGGKQGNGAAGADGNRAQEPPPVQAGMLFPDNFKGVCSGAPVSTATAYDPQGKSHKALYFATYKEDFTDQSSALPRDWTVQFSPSGDALRAIDLVVCARRTAAQQVKVCDKYQNKGSATTNKVRWHTATYELSVHEAKTGRELAKTSAQANASECPMFMAFTSDSDTVDGYASLPETVVADFLRPHMTH